MSQVTARTKGRKENERMPLSTVKAHQKAVSTKHILKRSKKKLKKKKKAMKKA